MYTQYKWILTTAQCQQLNLARKYGNAEVGINLKKGSKTLARDVYLGDRRIGGTLDLSDDGTYSDEEVADLLMG